MLGLDIGSRAIYLVRYGDSGVLAYGQYPTPPDSVVEGAVVDTRRVGEAIQRLLRAMRLREREVVLTVGGAQVMTKWVVVPAMSLEEL
ncbi:MAG: pilus assembly protein PilM, partial [Armatimonadetes bacterium]|nr:pilus assembly protein PilM [Armatimonadota bacterium]